MFESYRTKGFVYALGWSCAYLVLGSKSKIDWIVNNPNLPDYLNPYVGLILLYMVMLLLVNIWWRYPARIRMWFLRRKSR